MSKALLYLGIFIAGFLGVSLWGFWITMRPLRIIIPGTPELYRLPAVDAVIEAADGLKLAGWFIPAKDGNRDAAVVLLHGYPAEKADMLSIAAGLHPRFATLLMDMRYFGKSQGRFTTLGLREGDDLKRAVDFLEDRGYGPIGVFGFSLGGAVGIMAAAGDERIRAVASYAAFSDLKALGLETYSNLWLLKYPLVELMRLWSRLFLGGDPTAISPLRAAGELTIPTLLIHSREDEQISFRHAERLRQALAVNRKAEFYLLERGRHGELPQDFGEQVLAFFQRHLAPPFP